ncbi:MAG: D-alanine--D-alanine ligase [Candidatus Binatia bacterium]
MKKKLRVAILFGGRSAEHEISLISARNIAAAMDRKKYRLIAIGIDKQGRWFCDQGGRLLRSRSAIRVELPRHSSAAAVLSGLSSLRALETADVVFPVLHGPFGEDGTVQGFLKLVNKPFVGAGVLGSAVGMDKDVMKRLLRDAGIPIARFMVFDSATRNKISFARVRRALGLPVFVKPANLGSSVGISKAARPAELTRAVEEAFRYDSKIVIEENISGREIECAVLGNENPIASVPGEIITGHAFYSYDAKYVDNKGARLVVPAELPPSAVRRVQELSVRTFQILCCSGMARVDFFLRGPGEIFVNEINTIPGFTAISMYPKMWGATGLSYSRLIDRLIQLALHRFRAQKRLRSSI